MNETKEAEGHDDVCGRSSSTSLSELTVCLTVCLHIKEEDKTPLLFIYLFVFEIKMFNELQINRDMFTVMKGECAFIAYDLES